MDDLGYLFAAYTAIWLVVFGYILFMQRKQKKLQQQLDLLREQLNRQDNEK
jgi:CcmD family protein